MVGYNNDPYEKLGVTHGASLIEIRKAYRKMALRYHPDRLDVNRCTLDELRYATGKFAEISAAYNLLNNPEAKRRFDYNCRYGAYDHHKKSSSGSRTATSSSTSNQNQDCSSSNCPQSSNPAHQSQSNAHRYNNQRRKQHYSRGRWDDTRRGEDGYNYDRNYTYPRGAAPVIFKFRGCPSSDIFWFNPIQLIVSYFKGKKFQTSTFAGETPDGSRQYVKKTTHIHKHEKEERLFTTTRIETTTIHKDGTRHVTIQQTGHPNVHCETTHISSSTTSNHKHNHHTSNSHSYSNKIHNNTTNENTAVPESDSTKQKQSATKNSTEKTPWYESIWEQIINKNCLESSMCGRNEAQSNDPLRNCPTKERTEGASNDENIYDTEKTTNDNVI